MATGTVRWFNDANGFGFVTPYNGGDDLFAHYFCDQHERFQDTLERVKKLVMK